MMRPALASSALFVFILNWSDYLIALLLTHDATGSTIPVYMASLSSSMTGSALRRQGGAWADRGGATDDHGDRDPEASRARADVRGAERMTEIVADTRRQACAPSETPAPAPTGGALCGWDSG